MTEPQTPRSGRKRRFSNKENNSHHSDARIEIKKSRRSFVPCVNEESLDVNRMSLRSGKNVLKNLNESNCETSESIVGISETSKTETLTPRKSASREKNRRKSTSLRNKSVDFNVSGVPDFSVSSTSILINKEDNYENLESVTAIDDDVGEALNTTFEVADEDSILQSPEHKQSVRFATSVEVRRRTASFSATPDATPFSTPEPYKSSSQHKGTPHPSSKKHPLSILKGSSTKKSLSSSKFVSQKKNSAIKMPDFNSIHQAQFEKMESIADFNNRRRKCARKLTNHASMKSCGNKETSTAVSKIPKIESAANITVPTQRNSKPGTPLPSRRFHSEAFTTSSYPVLTEKNFDARRSTPHSNVKPTLCNSNINHDLKPESKLKPHKVTYEQAKAMIQRRLPVAALKRDSETMRNRNILKGVRLNRRFELQMQHRNLNMN